MARQKSSDQELIRQKLLESGLALLELKGFNATGIQEIATDSGIVKGSFYNYFSSKEAFAVEIIHYYTIRYIARLEALLQAQGAEDSYASMERVFLQLVQDYETITPKKGCLIGNLAGEISEASEECRMAMHEAVEQFKAIIEKRLFQGQQTGRVRTDLSAKRLADLFWNSWQGSLLQMQVENSAQPVEDTLDTLFHQLLTQPI